MPDSLADRPGLAGRMGGTSQTIRLLKVVDWRKRSYGIDVGQTPGRDTSGE